MCAALAISENLLCCAEDSDSLDNIADSPSNSRSSAMDIASLSASISMDTFFTSPKGEDCREVLLAMERKEKNFMPDWEKIKSQGEEIFAHRKKLVTRMDTLCQKLRFGDATFFVAVNILDRFLSLHTVKDNEKVLFPLIGIACVSISAKMAEVSIPSLKTLQAFMGQDLPFNPAHIRRTEMGILNCLGWAVNCITPYTVLGYVMVDGKTGGVERDEANRIFHETVMELKKSVLTREYLVHTATETAKACIAMAEGNFVNNVKRSHEFDAAYPNKRARSPTTPLCSQWAF